MLKSKLNLAAVGVLAATLSMQSMAQEVVNVQAPLSVDELSFAFADVGSADVLAMSQGEMMETEGAALPLIVLGGAALSAWGYHGISFHRTGRIGTSSGAAWAAGAGALGAVHGGGLAAVGGVRGAQAAYLGGRGLAVSSTWNAANPALHRPQNIQINHNTHQMNQQMLNQNLYGDFQRFANTQQNLQGLRMSCVSMPGSGFAPHCSYF